VWGREIAIGQAFLEDGIGHLGVQRQAFRLPVFFIPTETEPAQALIDEVSEASYCAGHRYRQYAGSWCRRCGGVQPVK